ncbi:MAG: sulfotransferase family protein [Geminicoccaceae bacterium]
MTKPTFLGLGAQKCASSWIHQVLQSHPDVFVSDPKELDFFTNIYNRGYTWYEQHFDGAGAAKAIGEVSPSYFCDQQAPERVYRYDPDIKLVLSLRDPIKRAFSNHLHEIRKGHYQGDDLTFEAALPANPMYVEQSRYGKHLARWLEIFPIEQILILIHEDIAAEPIAQVRRLYAFLNVDPDHQSEFLHKRSHETVGAKMPAIFKAWRAAGDFGRRHGMGNLVAATKNLPPVRAAMAANRRDLKSEIPAMRPETEEKLRQDLASDIDQLARLTGRQDWPWPTWQKLPANQAGSDPQAQGTLLSLSLPSGSTT